MAPGRTPSHRHASPQRPPRIGEFETLLSIVDPTSDETSITGNVYPRCTRRGDLTITVAVVHAGGWNSARAPVRVTASIRQGGGWQNLASGDIEGHVTLETAEAIGEATPQYRAQFERAVIALGDRNPGDLFRLSIEGDTAPAAGSTEAQLPARLRVHVDAGSAMLVHEIPTGPNTSIGVNAFHLESESPVRLYVQPIAEEVRIRHFNGKAFTVREAIGWTRLDVLPRDVVDSLIG